MIPCDVSWAAGLFEGEGSITFDRSDARIYTRINMTDEEPIRRFAEIIGYGKVYGPYQYDSNRKPYWCWYARTDEALKVIDILSPWLSPRRLARAEEVRELAKTSKPRRANGWQRQRDALAARAATA